MSRSARALRHAQAACKRAYHHSRFWELKAQLKLEYESIPNFSFGDSFTVAEKRERTGKYLHPRSKWENYYSLFGPTYAHSVALVGSVGEFLGRKIEEGLIVPCAYLDFAMKCLSYSSYDGALDAADFLGDLLGYPVNRLTDFAMSHELIRKVVAKVNRPSYYDRENARRRELAAARRKIHRRTTTAPQPTPEVLLAAWKARKESKENMIRLGGMLHDLECYVDNRLRINEYGRIIGRNGGIKSYLDECVPELAVHYKTLMRYKAMAKKLRQATGTHDPTPTETLLTQKKRHPIVNEIMVRKSFEGERKDGVEGLKRGRGSVKRGRSEERRKGGVFGKDGNLKLRIERELRMERETFVSIERVLNRYVTPD